MKIIGADFASHEFFNTKLTKIQSEKRLSLSITAFGRICCLKMTFL